MLVVNYALRRASISDWAGLDKSDISFDCYMVSCMPIALCYMRVHAQRIVNKEDHACELQAALCHWLLLMRLLENTNFIIC